MGRNQLAYEAMVSGEGIKAKNLEKLFRFYDQGIYDEFVKPLCVDQEGEAVGRADLECHSVFQFRADEPDRLLGPLWMGIHWLKGLVTV